MSTLVKNTLQQRRLILTGVTLLLFLYLHFSSSVVSVSSSYIAPNNASFRALGCQKSLFKKGEHEPVAELSAPCVDFKICPILYPASYQLSARYHHAKATACFLDHGTLHHWITHADELHFESLEGDLVAEKLLFEYWNDKERIEGSAQGGQFYLSGDHPVVVLNQSVFERTAS